MSILTKSWVNGYWWVVAGSTEPTASRVGGYRVEGPEDMTEEELLSALLP